MEILFWISLLFIVYPYFGYPVLLGIIAKLRSKPFQKGIIWPKVSVIIAAHNEERAIENRLRNLKDVDYPREKLEIIIVSDGSTDKTNQLIKDFKKKSAMDNISLVYLPLRVGKSGAIRSGVQNASGEILVFSDANTQFDSLAINELVKCFKDKRVGGVSGQVRIYDKDELKTSKGEGLYWRVEDFIKRKETQIHSVMGADGSIYAIRKELFIAPEKGVAYSDDFIISMLVVPQGFRLVYAPEAIACEESSKDFISEFKRKIRSTSGGLHGYQKLWKKGMLNPIKSPVWWQLISHRLVRFGVPWAMIVVLISNIFLNRSFYKITLACQIGFYLFAIAGLVLPRSLRRKKIFYIPFYFSFMQFIFVPSLFRFIGGKTETSWEKMGR